MNEPFDDKWDYSGSLVKKSKYCFDWWIKSKAPPRIGGKCVKRGQGWEQTLGMTGSNQIDWLAVASPEGMY